MTPTERTILAAGARRAAAVLASGGPLPPAACCHTAYLVLAHACESLLAMSHEDSAADADEARRQP